MAKHEFFKTEFEKLAINGFIGHPDGAPAYAYLRVSSDEQGDEGRSGLPRQIEHIHEKAYQEQRRIPWDMVYADDYTGFELERPELSRLRQELRQHSRRADAVVIEHLDRLSRNADWHQGFLLDEMKQLGVTPLFWKSFSSRIERAVMGAISQEGMEQAKQRMMEGIKHKARSGRVTARTPAYGYKLVDEHGREGERARKFTHYAVREDEARLVRSIFQQVASGETLLRIAHDLACGWDTTRLRTMIKNPVYKGEFIANRWVQEQLQKPAKDGISMRKVWTRRLRPEAEWIRVPVPAIVDEATWQAANDMLAKNKAMAKRNAKEPYLLTGLIRCASCGYICTGATHRVNRKDKQYVYRNYRCQNAYHAVRYNRNCRQSEIRADIIEYAVWDVVCTALLQPDLLVRELEAGMLDDNNAQVERQIAFLEQEIEGKRDEDEKLYRAYMANVFDENEYAARRALLKDERSRLETELEQLRPLLTTREQFEAQKALILDFSERVRSMDMHRDPPFEVKQRIIKLMVSQIMLDTDAQTICLEGAIKGVIPIASISAMRYTLVNCRLYFNVDQEIDPTR